MEEIVARVGLSLSERTNFLIPIHVTRGVHHIILAPCSGMDFLEMSPLGASPIYLVFLGMSPFGASPICLIFFWNVSVGSIPDLSDFLGNVSVGRFLIHLDFLGTFPVGTFPIYLGFFGPSPWGASLAYLVIMGMSLTHPYYSYDFSGIELFSPIGKGSESLLSPQPQCDYVFFSIKGWLSVLPMD